MRKKAKSFYELDADKIKAEIAVKTAIKVKNLVARRCKRLATLERQAQRALEKASDAYTDAVTAYHAAVRARAQAIADDPTLPAVKAHTPEHVQARRVARFEAMLAENGLLLAENWIDERTGGHELHGAEVRARRLVEQRDRLEKDFDREQGEL